MFEIISTCKGGGYMYCRTTPVHPKANSKGLYPLHRVIVENRIGRLLTYNEIVHHVNEDKSDNSPENLVLMSRSEHTKLHELGEVIKLNCRICGKEFHLKPHQHRLRLRNKKTDKLACSRSCGAKKFPF